jgi:serine/threonine-protein kinase
LIRADGFTKPLPVQVSSTLPEGTLVGTNPAAGQIVAIDSPIQIQVSLGNQFMMPDLRGQFWTDAEPLLRSLGWTGGLVKGPNAQNSGVPSNGVVTQSPAANTPANKSDPVTLSFAQ